MLRKLLSTTMVTIFAVNGLVVSKVDAVGNEEGQVEVNLPTLSPMPENLQINDGVLTITDSVNITGTDVADEDAMRILNELLVANNITVNESFDENSSTIVIGEVEDNIEAMTTTSNAETLKEEGYVLEVNEEDKTIYIEGKNGDGTFYGVKTLAQLLVESGEDLVLREVVISDEPTMGTRGIVEGFYGTPWTHADRLDQFEFYGDHKMNTYIYAPKDDPYHRNQWRDPYPESEMTRMNELISTAHENKVDFVFAISPGGDIEFDGAQGEADFQSLMTKCESLYQMGVRSFAILYDDIHNKDAAKQAQVLNRFNEEFIKVKGDVKPLITVPTEYDTFAMNAGGQISTYTRAFADTLDEDVMVMWTGEGVVPEGIDLENAQFVNSVYGKRMGIWWNYPVTDYMKEKLALGPIYNVDTALEGEIDFFTMNPMEHAQMSKVSLASGASYSWNTSEYDDDQSWKDAIKVEYGTLADAMTTFANHSSRMSTTGRADAPEVRATMDSLISKLGKALDATAEINQLDAEFDRMISAADTLKASLSSDELSEANGSLDKLKLLGQNGKIALDLLVAESEGDTAEVNSLKSTLNGVMSSLTSGRKVSEKTVLAFIQDAVSVGLAPKAAFDVSDTLIAPGESVTFTNNSSIATAEIEWRFEGGNIETSTEGSPTVTFAEEGIYTVELVARNGLGEDTVVREDIITVSENAGATITNLSLNKSTTASGSVSQTEAPRFAVDGNDSTKWCVISGGTSSITIDLGQMSTITNVVMKHAGHGGEAKSMNTRDYRIQVSEDGTNFTEIADINGNTADMTNDKLKVSNARYVKVLVDKPTQVTDAATRIFEIEVMGIEDAIELPPEYVVGAGDDLIYPLAQEINYISEDGMTFTGQVNVVVNTDNDDITLKKLERVLEENKIDYVVSDAIDNTKANILVSSNKENVEGLDVDDLLDEKALDMNEGYIIKATDDTNTKGVVSIVGADEDGAYNGVLSFAQLLEKREEGKFEEVAIADYPEIEFRGFIEGFYGTPWSHEDRMSLMTDTSDYKMNTYIYAPKDDVYHRAQWRDLYPEEEAAHIAELAKTGKDNNFNFCWTIHPGATLDFSDADYDALINKFEQLYDLGVRQFGVLFDDTDDWSRGRQQAEWINKIDTEFVKAKGDVEPMIVISARYNSAWGPNMNSYFKPFMQTLHDDIQVMWTGHATMSNISKDVFEWPKEQTGVDKDLAVWWNYPVNDYCDSRLLMAPLHNLDRDLDNVSAFYSNPMNQAEASKVALYSIADYTWNTDQFDYTTSWEIAIEKLVPEVKEEFMRFAGNVSYLQDDGGASGAFVYDESVYLREKIDALKEVAASGASIVDAANALKAEFELIVSDYESMVSKIENANLLDEIQIFLDSYKALGEAGVAAMDALIAAEGGNLEGWLNSNNVATEKIELMDTYVIDRVESDGERQYVVAVGEKRLKPIVEEMIAHSVNVIAETVFENYDPMVISSINGLEGIVNFEGGKYVAEPITDITLADDGYVGVVLPRATKVGSLKVNVSNATDLVVKHSLNGIDWEETEVTVTDGVITASDVLEATYIKVVNNSGVDKILNLNSIEVTPVYRAEPSISQNIGQYQSNSIENALDGDMNTKYWSDKPSSAGHKIQVDLGNPIPLHDVTAYFGNSDYMRNSEYLISEDGVNWTSLGSLQYETVGDKKVAKVDAEGAMARYIKIESKGSNDGFWVQLYELEINESVPDYGSDVVELVTGSPDGRFDYLYDRNLTTAYEAEEVSEGDELIYKMTRVTSVKELLILQDIDHITEAVVSVKDLAGNWNEVGILGSQLNTIAVNDNITEVKFAFNPEKPTPKIYEIITRKDNSVEDVYKHDLELAVEKAREITEEQLSNVVPAVAEEFREAFAEAKEILADNSVTQSQVNASFIRLSNVLQMLEFNKGDKAVLQSLVDKIDALDSNQYIAQTWEALAPVLVNAKAVLANANALEHEVEESYEATLRAFLNLRLKPSKDRLEDLINRAESLDESKYTAASFKAVRSSLEVAKVVFADENATEKEIAKAEADLEKSMSYLIASADGDKDNNDNDNKDDDKDLPQTGGVSGVAVTFFGAITSLLGVNMFKKKNK